MVSINDFPAKLGALGTDEAPLKHPRKRRFRLFAALAAPFKDIDDRAVRKKGPEAKIRNNSKGNLFARSAVAPAKVPIKRFPRGGD